MIGNSLALMGLVAGTLTVDSAGLVTNITGTMEGGTIGALEPVGFPGCTGIGVCGVGSTPNSDNVFNTTAPYLTANGIAFETTGGGGGVTAPDGLYYNGTNYTLVDDAGSVITIDTGSFTISSVPGPIVGSGLPGLIFASGGLLAWWRRKRKAEAI
jgi:hypothetical protein